MFTEYVSMKSVIYEWLSDFNMINMNYNEEWAIRNILTCLDYLHVKAHLDYRVTLLNIDNHSAALPVDLKLLDAAAYNYTEKKVSTLAVKEVIQKKFGTDTEYTLTVDCEGKDCEESDVIIENHWINRLLINQNAQHINFSRAIFNEPRVNSTFKPLRRATGKFDTMDLHTKDCINDTVVTTEYATYHIRDRRIHTNFPQGQVLIAYYSTKVDEDGLPMIPDDNLVIECIKFYLNEKAAFLDYSMKRDQANRIYWADMKLASDEAMRTARSRINSKVDVEEMERLTQMHTHLFPQDRYSNFWRESINPNYARPRYTNYTRDTTLPTIY